MVARAGVEPATFRFSGGRSYQLSYLARCPRLPPRTWATLTGLEPATSAVTGRRANQLRYRAKLSSWWNRPERTPYGIRTRAAALKGRCPGPLDEGGAPISGEHCPEDDPQRVSVGSGGKHRARPAPRPNARCAAGPHAPHRPPHAPHRPPHPPTGPHHPTAQAVDGFAGRCQRGGPLCERLEAR